MALKELKLEKPEFIKSGKIKLSVADVTDFIKKQKDKDIVYLDPPYNTRQYAAYFSVLESIVVNDKVKLQGKTGLRNYAKQKSKFSQKENVEKAFSELIDAIDSKVIIMSYSTEGILKREFIEKVFKNKGSLKVYDKNYRRFKTNQWTERNTNLKELLFICKTEG